MPADLSQELCRLRMILRSADYRGRRDGAASAALARMRQLSELSGQVELAYEVKRWNLRLQLLSV